MKLPSPEPYFYFIFFFITEHTVDDSKISLSLSPMTIIRRKKSNGYIYHTLGHCRKTAIFILLLLYTFFFYSTHAGDDCYNSNAPFAFLQPVRVRPRALLSFGRHFATGRTQYILIYYICAKRERRKTLSLELGGAAFIRDSFCRLNIILYYFIRANPIKLFHFEILKVSHLAINIATHRCTRRTYNILHTDNIYICMCNIIELSSPL